MKELGSELDHVDENGQTPLYYAIKSNKADLIEFLLQQKININNVDKRGQTPINFAVRHNKNNLKDLLVKYGATPP
jgi:ankyrin repeat protein